MIRDSYRGKVQCMTQPTTLALLQLVLFSLFIQLHLRGFGVYEHIGLYLQHVGCMLCIINCDKCF